MLAGLREALQAHVINAAETAGGRKLTAIELGGECWLGWDGSATFMGLPVDQAWDKSFVSFHRVLFENGPDEAPFDWGSSTVGWISPVTEPDNRLLCESLPESAP